MVGTTTVPDQNLEVPGLKHRGITHTVWFAALVGALSAGLLLQLSLPYSPLVLGAFGFAMGAGGILGHVLWGVLTPMGITPFAPVSSRRYSLGLFYAKNEIANQGFLLGGSVVWIAATAYPMVG